MRKPTVLFACLAVSAALALGAPSDKARTAAGTIARVQASQRIIAVTLAEGGLAEFLWTADTKISGILAPGARVTIRYTVAPDGRNLAQQISVSRS
jgi:hypothetical protein